MRREDKELSKYSKYKARVDLTKIGQVASVLAGVLSRGAALTRVRSRVSVLAFVCIFQMVRVASCHGRDSHGHPCDGVVAWRHLNLTLGLTS